MAANPDLTERIKDYAREVGFDAVGIARAEPFPDDRRVTRERIAVGHYSGLSWFTAARADFSSDPRNLLPTARSIISLAMSYRPEGAIPLCEGGAPRGRVSAYAWGRDYHAVLKERMERVVAYIRANHGQDQQARTLVDTARILDRAAARRAGVGWVGKHTNVITKAAGSWVFLGEILTELELAEDKPLRTNCGSCDLCLRACPTGAIVAPYEVQSDRCISYLTIEHRGIIPRELRPLMGAWIFGCDVCQEVCPPNHRPGGVPAHREFRPGGTELPMYNPVPPGTAGARSRCSPAPVPPGTAEAVTGRVTYQPAVVPAGAPRVFTGTTAVPAAVSVDTLPAGTPRALETGMHGQGIAFATGGSDDHSLAAPELIPLLDITQEEFSVRFGKTPVKRAKREGLQRNVAIALGNGGDRAAVPALARALREAAPVVRAHAAWALGRLGGPDAARTLRDALDGESEETVREEIELALGAP